MSRVERRIDSAKEEVNELEGVLAGALKPVRAAGDVMQRLQNRIGSLEPHPIVKRLPDWEFLIIVGGSVMSVAMVIVTVARALFYFFGRSKRGQTA